MTEEGLEIISLMSEFYRDFGQSFMKDLQSEDSDDLSACQVALVVSNSLQPYGPQSGSSVHGDSPGKNTGVGRHFLLQGIFPTQELVAQSCPTLCDPMDCSLSGSSVHGIFQASVLEWVAVSSSKELVIRGQEIKTKMRHC